MEAANERRHLQRDLPGLGAHAAGPAADRRARQSTGKERARRRNRRLLSEKQPMLSSRSRRASARSPFSSARDAAATITGSAYLDRRRLGGAVIANMIELLARAFGGDKSEKPKAGKRINLGTAGRRRARRVHLGRARPSARGRPADDRGISGASAGAVNAVMLARRSLRAADRKKRASASPISGARRASAATCLTVQRARRRPAVLILADRRYAGRPVDAGADAISVALRLQSAQHQSAEGSDRALRRF